MIPGTIVNIKEHDHPNGPCFAHGEGVVLYNQDIISREKGDILVFLGEDLIRFPESAVREGILTEVRA